MKQYTVDDIMALGPCHSRETIEGYFGRRKLLTLPQILRFECVSNADKLWVACRLVSRQQWDEWSEIFVARAITESLKADDSDPAWNRWANAWLDGSDHTEASADSASAWASASARASASASARASARARAWAAESTEEAQQIKDLLAVLKKYPDMESTPCA